MAYPTGKIVAAFGRHQADVVTGRVKQYKYPFVWYNYQTPAWFVRGVDDLSVTTGVTNVNDVNGAIRAARAVLTATGATA
jgi:hypothetical protein